MSDDYLWDRAGTPDLEIKWLEELLAPLAHGAPLDELRLAKGRRDLARATAQEPVDATPTKDRTKGNMNIFDKRIVGAAAVTAAALGLVGVSVVRSHVESRDPRPFQPPLIALAPSFAATPHASPAVPTSGADLVITAGESAKIHVPLGAVDVEIRSTCNAEVQMSVVTYMGPDLVVARPGDPPELAVEAIERRLRGEPPRTVPGPASGSHIPEGDPIVAGTASRDGRTVRYRLAPGIEPMGMVQYTARCVGQPPRHGVLEIDREDGHGPVGTITNARVFDDANNLTVEELALAQGRINVFGSVLPGATVTIDGEVMLLEPAALGSHDDPFVTQEFRSIRNVSADHPVVVTRVDDAHGTQFYVSRRVMAPTGATACTTAMTELKQTAAALDARDDHAGALRTLETMMKACQADRDTLAVALEYACEAGNAEAARTYWRKLPPELQREVESLCAQHAITRDQLDRN
jgi:hypothetical protein